MSQLTIPVSAHDHIQGDQSAAVTLVEYGDYECPYCTRAHPVLKRVQQQFGSDLRFVFRNFPLKELHPHAEIAAEAAGFAGAAGRFWEMHDGIYERKADLSEALLIELAQSLDLSEPNLRDALQRHEFADRVRADFVGGVRSGVNGTPTCFINDRRYDGPIEFDDLVSAVVMRAS